MSARGAHSAVQRHAAAQRGRPAAGRGPRGRVTPRTALQRRAGQGRGRSRRAAQHAGAPAGACGACWTLSSLLGSSCCTSRPPAIVPTYNAHSVKAILGGPAARRSPVAAPSINDRALTMHALRAYWPAEAPAGSCPGCGRPGERPPALLPRAPAQTPTHKLRAWIEFYARRLRARRAAPAGLLSAARTLARDPQPRRAAMRLAGAAEIGELTTHALIAPLATPTPPTTQNAAPALTGRP